MKLRRVSAPAQLILISIGIAMGSGCRHKPSPVAVAPPPPTLSPATTPSTPEPSPTPAPVPAPSAPVSPGSVADNQADADFVSSHPVIYSEEGLASWYGPPYDKRRGANGEIFDKDALTAAHRTLPMNSLIRVTNLASGQSVILRVTDRGPFVANRMLDLSLASAKAIGVWRPGVARVRVEVFAAPSSLDRGGRWCVQIGSLQDEDSAARLQDHLQRRYHEAKVIKFLSPVGVWWVRVRVAQDDRSRAEELARETQPDEGTVFLVRLD